MSTTGRLPPRPDTHSEARTWWLRLAVLAPPMATVVFPFLGPLAALVFTPMTAATLGPRVWETRGWKALVMSLFTLVALWATLVAASALGTSDGWQWLLIPLCAPVGSSAFVLPPAAAVVAYGAVAVVSTTTRRLWVWPLAAVAGGLAYQAVWGLLEQGGGVRWIC